MLTARTPSPGTRRILEAQMEVETELVDLNDVPQLADAWQAGRFQNMLRRMNERYRPLAMAVRVQQLGLSLPDYYRFSYLTPSLQGKTEDGQWRAITTLQKTLVHTRDNAMFCLDFMIGAALKIQDVQPLHD